jgi:hypothetical protein
MHLDIGSRAYSLSVVPGPLRRAGRQCASICDHQAQRILVSAAVPPELRTEIAALAVNEAWKHQTIQRPPFRFVGDVS